MTKLNFKTKKVTLPLDVNKTYVLVDVEEYCNLNTTNEKYTIKHSITNPFNFTYALYGEIDGDIIIDTLQGEHNFFREVIDYPESGDAVIMIETNSTGRYIAYDDKQHMHVINVDGVLTYAEDDEFELKQELSWQEVLCEEFDIDLDVHNWTFKMLRGFTQQGLIRFAKRIIELSGE